MTDEQVGEILIEVLRITRGFREAIQRISEQQAEIIALRGVLQRKGLVNDAELDIIRDEELQRHAELGAAPAAIERAVLDMVEGKWKM